MPGAGRCHGWLPEPDDVQDRQVPQRTVREEDDGQLANRCDAHVLALEVAGVPLGEAPGVSGRGVQDVPDHLLRMLRESGGRLRAGGDSRTAYG